MLYHFNCARLPSSIAWLSVAVVFAMCGAFAAVAGERAVIHGFGKTILERPQVAAGDVNGRLIGDRQEMISEYPNSSFYRLGAPIGRLMIHTDVTTHPCTAFLISQDLLMTNHHCGPGLLATSQAKSFGAKKVVARWLMLGYLGEGIEEQGSKFSVSPNPEDANRDLDYAIYRVFGVPKNFGFVRISAVEPQPMRPLMVIGHPLGRAQHISRERCRSHRPAVSGNRLLHTCDTSGGNSGSPVIDWDTRTAIAIHASGAPQQRINHAVPFELIAKRSAVLRAVLKEQSSTPPSDQPPPRLDAAWKPVIDQRFVNTVFQVELQKLGCYTAGIDGDWGPMSNGALLSFQRQKPDAKFVEPVVSPANFSIFRAIDEPVCRNQPVTRNDPPASSSGDTTSSGSARTPPDRRVVRQSGGNSCNSKAQRWCSNPSNSDAIGYQACMVQAKAGCRE